MPFSQVNMVTRIALTVCVFLEVNLFVHVLLLIVVFQALYCHFLKKIRSHIYILFKGATRRIFYIMTSSIIY